MAKKRIALFGASGTMGFHAFQELWKRRDEFDISILVLPTEQRLRQFRTYERQAGLLPVHGAGVAQGEGFKIVWGDATRFADVAETVRGADTVLDAMAYISPAADYHPEIARAVNTEATLNILRAIEAEPDGAQRIHFVYTGTVAATGNRPAGIHMGRVGDPLKPSVFDYYAVTKIAGERAVLESRIRHWVCLRMTFIMPTKYRELLNLMDPISLHMPLDACMENLTDRDAGYGMVRCLDLPENSDFWRKVYNMGGGEKMRCQAYEYLDRSIQLHGLPGISCCTERHWFALRNFHMQYFEDSSLLDSYLHYMRDDLETYWQEIQRDMPFWAKSTAWLCKKSPLVSRQIAKIIYQKFSGWANIHRNGTAYWLKQDNHLRVSAFFQDKQRYAQIPDWSAPLGLDPDMDWQRLDHGYDESKDRLETADLIQAAAFRGGQLLSQEWDGDFYSPLLWECGFGHRFQARPYTVLKAGHWCPVCVAPPWNFDEVARRDSHFAQVWRADHDPEENNFYPCECTEDILNADRVWENRQKKYLIFSL